MESQKGKVIDQEEKNIIKKKVSEREIEIWEVSGLSCRIASSCAASNVLKNYEEKLRLSHERTIKELVERLQEINVQTETDIKMSSAEFKAHVKDFEEKLKEMKEEIDKPEAASYNSSVFQEIKNKAKEFQSKQQMLVEDLRLDFLKFEKKRAKESEKLLQVYCEKIRKIGYFLPYKLQCYVEDQTLNMNHIFLNNRRCYDDLNFRLVLLTEQTYKSFFDQVECIQEKWANHIKQKVEPKCGRNSEKKAKIRNFELYERYELKGMELVVEVSSDEMYSICKVEDWSKNIVSSVSTIETYGQNLLDLFKKLLNAVLHNFDCENEEIKRMLYSINLLPIEERLIRPLLFKPQLELTKDVLHLESLWQDSLIEIRCVLKEVIDFLRDVGHLWENHLNRLCESKKLILMALEKVTESSEPFLQDLEVKLNISLDTLRQEHNKSKLEKEYESVIATLNKMKEKYESTYISEIETVEDFYKMMDLEADVFSAELKEFIYIFHSASGTKNIFYFYDHCSSLPEGKFICKEIRRCGHQIRALKMWKQGTWSALENLALNTRKCFEKRAETWIQSKIDILAERMSMKLELLQNRYERIRIEMYERRLAEIKYHEDSLTNHTDATKAAFQKAEEGLQALFERESNKLNALVETLDYFEDKLKDENQWGAIKSLQIKIERQKKEAEEKLRLAFATFKTNLETVADDLAQANIRFMKGIKLFHENGNYSAEEGAMYTTTLENLDKEINSKSEEVKEATAKYEDELSEKFFNTFAPVTTLLDSLHNESLFFHTVEERINKTKERLEEIAKEFKFDFDVLNGEVDCLCRVLASRGKAINKIGSPSWNKLLAFLYKNVSNLFYPLTLAEESAAENEEEKEKLSVTFSQQGLQFDNKLPVYEVSTKGTRKPFPCADYMKQLFPGEEIGKNDGTFLAAINNLIWSEMSHLQKIACTFYENAEGSKVHRTDLIEETYDLWAKNTLEVFRTLKFQCVVLWLKTASEFLPLVGKIKSMANCYLQRKLEEYEECILTALKNYEDKFKEYLENEESQTENIYEDLDKKLLALHGYFGNQSLLEALEEEVIRRTSKLGIDWDDAIQKFVNQIACFRMNHVCQQNEIKNIESEYEILKVKIFNENLGNNLLNKALDYIYKSGNNITASKNSEAPGSDSISDKYRLNFFKNFQNFQFYFDELNILAKNESFDLGNKKNVGTILARPERSLDSPLRHPCWNVSPSKVGVLFEPVQLKEQAESICKKIEASLWQMQSFADSKRNVCKDRLFKWLRLWKRNVDKVRALYSFGENTQNF